MPQLLTMGKKVPEEEASSSLQARTRVSIERIQAEEDSSLAKAVEISIRLTSALWRDVFKSQVKPFLARSASDIPHRTTFARSFFIPFLLRDTSISSLLSNPLKREIPRSRAAQHLSSTRAPYQPESSPPCHSLSLTFPLESRASTHPSFQGNNLVVATSLRERRCLIKLQRALPPRLPLIRTAKMEPLAGVLEEAETGKSYRPVATTT